MDPIFQLIIAILVLIAIWYILEKFSPDPLITKLVQIGLFIAALYIVWKLLFPMLGL